MALRRQVLPSVKGIVRQSLALRSVLSVAVVGIPATAVQGERTAEVVFIIQGVGIYMRLSVGFRLARIIHHRPGLQILMRTREV